MEPLGSISMGPSDTSKDVGLITLPEGADTLWLRVVQLSPIENWKYSYGLCSFVTEAGAELGTQQIYGNQQGEIYRLGTGRVPQFRTGVLRFTCRAYNLRWLSAEGAPNWTLQFFWEAGGSPSANTGDLAVISGVADQRDGSPLRFVQVDFTES